MAEFKQGNIKVKSDKSLVFGNNDEYSITHNSAQDQLIVDGLISGIDPVAANDLSTKNYVDTTATTLSGAIETSMEHGELRGLENDDHPQYLTVVSGAALYYSQTELDEGVLDPVYYPRAEAESTFASGIHNHTEADITDLDKYTQAEADAAFAALSHQHTEADITDLDKYTQQEVDDGFSATGHQHSEADVTDLDKYTQQEVDDAITTATGTLAPEVHQHVEADITDLSDDTLDGKNVNAASPTDGQFLKFIDGQGEDQWQASSDVDATTLNGEGTQWTSPAIGEAVVFKDDGGGGAIIDGKVLTESDISDLDKYTQAEVNTISGALSSEIDSDIAAHTAIANPHGTTGSDIVHDPTSGETVTQMFNETVNGGVMEQTVVTVVSGLNISWTSCEIYDRENKTVVEPSSGSGAVTDNAISYLNWVSGTTLTLSTSEADGDEVGLAHFHAQGGVIYSIHYEEELNVRERSMSRALEDILGTIVTSGCLVSEYSGGTGLDIEVGIGTYYHEGHSKVSISGTNSVDNELYRWYHDGAGAWTYDRNASVDTTQYDTGTGLAALTNNKYAKSMFIIGPADESHGYTIHWFYPQAEYVSAAAAIAGALPTNPAASDHYPHSVALVYQEGDASLPALGSDNWIDIRPIIGTGVGGAGSVTDHGNLTGLGDDDHTQYLNTSRGDARYYQESEVDSAIVTFSGTIDHDTILNNHNLTTDIDHDQLTNFASNEHFTEASIDHANITAGTGADHTYIDQDVTSGSSPTFTATNITGGDIHSESHTVASHSDTSATGSELDELTDGSETTLHSHAGAGGDAQSGNYSISNATKEFTISFSPNYSDTAYALVGDILNTTDANPAQYAYTITAATVSGATIELSDITDSANYEFQWRAGFGGDQGVQGETGASGIQGIQGETGENGGTDIVLDTTPQLGGDLDTNNFSIEVDAVPASDHEGTGIISTMTVDVNSYGIASALHLDTDGNFIEADADADTTMPCMALALETGTGSKQVLLQGFMRDDTWAWTVGGRIYVSTTAGTLTQTAPSGSGDCVQPVGIATHADRIWFSPTLDFVEVA